LAETSNKEALFAAFNKKLNKLIDYSQLKNKEYYPCKGNDLSYREI